MALGYGSALLGLLLLCGCHPDPLPDREIRITLHQLENCEISSGADLQLFALGDFDATNRTTETLVASDERAALLFPATTRAVRVEASFGQRAWSGLSAALGQTELPVLLWERGSPCTLFSRGPAGSYPGEGGGQALGLSADGRYVLVAGGDAPESAAIVGALLVDLATGESTVVDASAQHVLREPRAFATATAFGDGMLVAGGEDPLFSDVEPNLRVRGTAEVFDISSARFDLELVNLVVARARHAAVTLPDGSTALIGGRNEDGLALDRIEAVSPVTRTSSLGGRAQLRFDRIAPVVFALDDGRLFVGGGESSDGSLIEALEWLSPNAGKNWTPENDVFIPARIGRSFVPLPGGAVLAVGGCEDREPANAGEAAACAVCERGCRPSDGWDAHWIDAHGRTTRIPLDFAAPHPALVPQSDGAPLLIADTRASTLEWRRFNPWRERFELEAAPAPALVQSTPFAIDPGAVAWLGSDGMAGQRFDTRSRFAQDIALIALTRELDSAWPRHLAPAKPPSRGGVTYDGRLHLADGAVWVTDTDYSDATIELTRISGAPPVVLLGSGDAALDSTLPEDVELPFADFGVSRFGADAACPWPEESGTLPEILVVLRRGKRLALRRGSNETLCDGPDGRVRVGLEGPAGAASQLSLITLARGAP